MNGSKAMVRGVQSVWAHPSLLVMAALTVAITLTSCASTGGGGKSAPEITLTDYRAQNIERVRDGVIALVGDDSGGSAAREYIKAFEDDLAMRLPTQAGMPEPEEEQEINPNAELASLYLVRRFERTQRDQAVNQIAPDPKILELKRYLDARKAEAIGDLMEQSTVFASGGGTPTAKLGLAASYIAIACANQPGDIETIVKLVDPLLAHLKPKK